MKMRNCAVVVVGLLFVSPLLADQIAESPGAGKEHFSAQADPIQKQFSEPFLTAAIIDSGRPGIERPYEDAPQDFVELGGKRVYRPNHGLVQGARVATLVRDVIKVLIDSPTGGKLGSWLKAKMKTDPNFLKKFAVVALAHRSGRTSEVDSFGDPDKRNKEFAMAVKNFDNAVPKSKVPFPASEMKDWEKAISLDGATNDNVTQSNLSRVLRAAHILDLVRLPQIPARKLAHQGMPELTESQLSHLLDGARGLVKTTGCENYNFTKRFIELSTNTSELANTLNPK